MQKRRVLIVKLVLTLSFCGGLQGKAQVLKPDTTFNVLAKGQVVETSVYGKKSYNYYVDYGYPALGRENGVEGVMSVAYEFDANCSVRNIAYTGSLGKDFEQTILKQIWRVSQLVRFYEPENCEGWSRRDTVRFNLHLHP